MRHRIRTSTLLIAILQQIIHKNAQVHFPWNATQHIPYFTATPPHFMMMTELETLGMKLDEHNDAIADGLIDELDRSSAGG